MKKSFFFAIVVLGMAFAVFTGCTSIKEICSCTQEHCPREIQAAAKNSSNALHQDIRELAVIKHNFFLKAGPYIKENYEIESSGFVYYLLAVLDGKYSISDHRHYDILLEEYTRYMKNRKRIYKYRKMMRKDLVRFKLESQRKNPYYILLKPDVEHEISVLNYHLSWDQKSLDPRYRTL